MTPRARHQDCYHRVVRNAVIVTVSLVTLAVASGVRAEDKAAAKGSPGDRYKVASQAAAAGKPDQALALLRELASLDTAEAWRLVEGTKLDDDWRSLWMDERWVELAQPDEWPEAIDTGWFQTGCPAGTKMVKKGKLPKAGETRRGGAVWCEKKVGKKKVKHGPYTEWMEMPSWSHSEMEETHKLAEGEYADGVRVGIWTFWDLQARCGYRNGKPHGRWVELRDEGPSHRAWSVGVFIDGVAEGVHLDFDSEVAGGDAPAVEQEYRAGKRQGRYLRRDRDGAVEEEGTFVDERREGAWKELIEVPWLDWYMRASGRYVADRRDGVWTITDEGAKSWELTYAAGVLDGEQRRFGKKGKVVGS